MLEDRRARIAARDPKTAPARFGELRRHALGRQRIGGDEELTHRVVAERGVEIEIELPAFDGVGQRGVGEQIVERLGDLRRAAMAVAHLARDPARIDRRVRAARARSPGAAAARRCARVASNRRDRSPASRPASPPRRRSRLRARRRRRNRARPGPPCPGRERARRRARSSSPNPAVRAALAGAVIGMARRLEIGAAQFVALAPVAARQYSAEAHAIAAGRRAENAGGRLAGQRIVLGAFLERGDGRKAASSSAICVGKTSRNSPEMRIVTSTRGRPSIASGKISKALTRFEARSHFGRAPISANACAISSPPVRIEALPQRSSTMRRGQSP